MSNLWPPDPFGEWSGFIENARNGVAGMPEVDWSRSADLVSPPGLPMTLSKKQKKKQKGQATFL